MLRQTAVVRRAPADTILNPEELTANQVVHQKVLCPACGVFPFQMWPEGWDAHAASNCAGVSGSDKERKAEFKRRFRHLFR